jgi:hypothetical protein
MNSLDLPQTEYNLRSKRPKLLVRHLCILGESLELLRETRQLLLQVNDHAQALPKRLAAKVPQDQEVHLQRVVGEELVARTQPVQREAAVVVKPFSDAEAGHVLVRVDDHVAPLEGGSFLERSDRHFV